MTRRRPFSVNPPVTFEDGVAPAHRPGRGPMASAINENATALRQQRNRRGRGERAENDALWRGELVALRGRGLVLASVSVDAVRADLLTRDRAAGPDESLEGPGDLHRGGRPVQSDPRGWRTGRGASSWSRAIAAYRPYRAPARADGVTRAGSEIPAALIEGPQAEEILYRRMVDENLVRENVSLAEMAALARTYAARGVDGLPRRGPPRSTRCSRRPARRSGPTSGSS